ncbi:hypothetical protein GCM10023208_15720 [Erythrobacter westpacificensis]|uniref:Nucleotidyltransferase n=1 Tax=Erythrobacter westpacificensis TaxID=1055231 RepID=A0ABP9K965_9SPHN
MAVDRFSLEDALRLAAHRLHADHAAIMRSAALIGPTISDTLAGHFRIRRSFTAGSVMRQTWADTRREMDLIIVLDDVHRGHLGSPPAILIEQFAAILRETHYTNRRKGMRHAAVGIGGPESYAFSCPPRIIAVPAFEAPRGIFIPDQWNERWICIDPGGFDALCENADRQYPGWRNLVQVLKTWNNRDEKFEPFIKPGLLIEAMAMEIAPSLGGLDLGLQLSVMFQTMYERFDEEWPDPAGLAPALTSYMSPKRRAFARQHVQHAWLTLAQAKKANDRQDYREAKRLARSVLGRIVSTAPRDEYGDLVEVKPGERIY